MSRKIIIIFLAAIILVAAGSVLAIQHTDSLTENSTTPTETETVTPTNNPPEIVKNDTEFDSVKERIVELFPNILLSSLTPTQDCDSQIPEIRYILYENALTEKGEKYDIKVDYETREIRSYRSTEPQLSRSEEPEISLEEAEEIALEFLKKLKGDRYDEVIEESHIITKDWENTYADVRLKRFHNDVQFYIGSIHLIIDLKTGEVAEFYQRWPDFKNSTFSSPEPEITPDEAKQIIETTINEKDSETRGCIKYYYDSVNSETMEPYWYSNYVLLWYEKDMPVRLVWRIDFTVNTKDETETEDSGHNFTLYTAVVDAHSGEILSMTSPNFRIYKPNEYIESASEGSAT
ncbi:hypothetical protein [Methanogenium cariaci]